MDKTLLLPCSGTEYESNICELEKYLFDAVNEGDVVMNDDSSAYEFQISDLDYEFPVDAESREAICSDIRDELDFRLQSYNEALAAHAANSDEDEQEDYSYMPPNVWIEDETLYVQF